MTESIRSVTRWLHHLPWMAAGIVLACGLVVYVVRQNSNQPALSIPGEAEAPAFQMTEEAFREAVKFDEVFENPFPKDKR